MSAKTICPAGRTTSGLRVPKFSRSTAPPSGHGEPLTAKKDQNFRNFFEAGHSEHASRSAHGPYVYAPGASVSTGPADHVAAGRAASFKPPGV